VGRGVTPIRERFFTVAPLVLVATKEGASHDVAPKHLAMPPGWEIYPDFTVSFPGTDLIMQASMAAAPRLGDGSKPSVAAVPVFPARKVDAVLVQGCAVYLECTLGRVIDGFGENSLSVGRVVSASVPRAGLRGHDVDDAELLYRLRPFVYLAPGRVAEVRETRAFPFPAEFAR